MIETMLWFIGTMTAEITMVGTDIMRNVARCACAYEVAERQRDHQDASQLLIDCLLTSLSDASPGATAFVPGLNFPRYLGSGNANFSFSGGNIRNTFSVNEIST